MLLPTACTGSDCRAGNKSWPPCFRFTSMGPTNGRPWYFVMSAQSCGQLLVGRAVPCASPPVRRQTWLKLVFHKKYMEEIKWGVNCIFHGEQSPLSPFSQCELAIRDKFNSEPAPATTVHCMWDSSSPIVLQLSAYPFFCQVMTRSRLGYFKHMHFVTVSGYFWSVVCYGSKARTGCLVCHRH